ncbi:MAG: response regulator, partial [Deltaproteobacteria bacterium]|nr:response regulator [Deltaproteobacteria bacterium]
MKRRVLIIEHRSEFALTLAAALKDLGVQTAVAASAADGLRDVEKRKPDAVILLAELEDRSGFVVCGELKKGKHGPAVPVVLLCSDVGEEHVTAH